MAVAKAGVEDGFPLIGGSLVVDPNREIVAEASTEGDELLVHPCDLDATLFGGHAVVLQLVDRLRREDNLSLLFVSHDLNVVRMMCDHTIVLRDGRIVEQGESRALFDDRLYPRTGRRRASYWRGTGCCRHLIFASNMTGATRFISSVM